MALKSNELKIGNFISHETWGEHVVMEVKEISQYRAYLEVDTGYLADFNLNEANGIPLTEEWLLKFGFRKFSSTQFDTLDFWAIGYQEKGSHKGEFYCNQLECYIKYVHELQNLYFALTKNELVIKSALGKV